MSILDNVPLTPELKNCLSKEIVIQTYDIGEQIIHQESCLIENIIVLNGLIKIYKEFNGKKVLLYHYENDDICSLNYLSIWGRLPIHYSGTALKPTTLLFISQEKVMHLSQRYPELRNLIIKSHQQHYNNLLKTLKTNIERPLHYRLFEYLKYKSEQLKTQELKIPHAEISTDFNLSRESISRALKKLEEQNKIIKKPRSILILEYIHD